MDMNTETHESSGDSLGPGEDGMEPEDCPTCGYPGCDNRCVCDICGVGPNYHSEKCGQSAADRILDDLQDPAADQESDNGDAN